MRYATFSDAQRGNYPICVLVPHIQKSSILDTYIRPFGLDPDEVLALDLHYRPDGKKAPAAEMKAYIEQELAPTFTDLQVKYLLVADGEYFKALTKATKVEVNLGYVLDCTFADCKVVYVPHWSQIFYDPDKTKAKIALGIEAMLQHRLGNYQAPGSAIIKFAAYPSTVEEIQDWLERLIAMDVPLTCDIEGFSLKHHTAGIGTISFAWNRHEGIAFPVDLGPDPTTVRALLKSFFIRFTQKITYHFINYDAYVLIYQLFMEHIIDTEGLLYGLEVMLRNWDDTKLIAYLATNSCAGNNLKLKHLAQEFAGNWAVDSEDIKDIQRIPLPQLLEYNLVDALSTWYVKDKYEPVMIADQQQPLYEGLFKDTTVDIIQMQLTGLPIDMARTLEVEQELQAEEARSLYEIMNSTLVRQFTLVLQQQHVATRNAKLKKKQITLQDDEVQAVMLNPGSAPQLQALLYDFLKLPVIARTDAGLPATGGKVLKALLNHVQDPDQAHLLEALIDWKAVQKILTDFIPNMKEAAQGPDGWHYLFGNFNLGGTLSGRLSSSGPNLQNLPATGSRYASIIKSCFRAPPGWLFGGLDFASLEDKISALTTKDPNKIKVYTDGYDGHSLRAHAYFGQLMPDIRISAGKRTFMVTQNGTVHYLIEGDQVQLSDGSVRLIEELLP